MALDPRYITGIELEDYFVDKDTGAPLAGGIVTFYQDNNRIIPKLVYELVNLGPPNGPPNYTYSPLPNPLILNGVGTFQDNNGNNIAVYYFPFDANGNPQLYYITVTNSLGVPQFTREAWPNTFGEVTPTNAGNNLTNMIQNPEFRFTLFDPGTYYNDNTYTQIGIGATTQTPTASISYTGSGTASVNIAQNWFLFYTYTNAGSITVTKTAVAGNAQLPTNPSYTLDIVPGANLSALSLQQIFLGDPDIFSPSSTGTNGWVGTNIVLGAGTSATINYVPSSGASQQLLTANNLTPNYVEYSNTVQLTPASNPQVGGQGSITIQIVLSTTANSSITSVQVVGLEANITPISYQQVSYLRDLSLQYEFYSSDLQVKPTPNYLSCWDFPLNPAQILGTNVAAQALGNNTSYYAWDQTILFQTVTNSLTVARGTAAVLGAFQMTATANTQPAMIQYLSGKDAVRFMQDPFSIFLKMTTTNVAPLNCTISFWLTTAASLPSLGSNQSLIATMDANGLPLTFNGTWIQMPAANGLRSQINNIQTAYFNYGFNNFTAPLIANNVVTFVAIVIGFSTLTSGSLIVVDQVSVNPGRIATLPGVQKEHAVLEDAQRYYEKSFNPNVVPVQGPGMTGTGENFYTAVLAGAQIQHGPSVYFQTTKRVPPTMTGFSPGAANAQVWDGTINQSCSLTNFTNVTQRQFFITCTGAVAGGGTLVGDSLGLHWVADSRLGVV